MNLVAFLTALAAQIAALTERIDAMTTMGMTDAEALAFGELKAQVAAMAEQLGGLQTALQTVIQTQAAHAESLTSINGRLGSMAEDMAAIGERVDGLSTGIGDLSGLPALPTP